MRQANLWRVSQRKEEKTNMIKDKTKCKIVVGQNGLVWVKGDEDMEQLTKNIIHLIEAEAHTSGLTNKIKNKFCLYFVIIMICAVNVLLNKPIKLTFITCITVSIANCRVVSFQFKSKLN